MTDHKSPTHAGGVVVHRFESGHRYLLVSARRQPTQLVLPKGHIEHGETAEEAAVREVQEEAGVAARVRSRLGILEYKSPRGRVRAEFFLMELVSEEPTAGEGRRREWLAIEDAIRALLYEDAQQLIRDAEQALERR